MCGIAGFWSAPDRNEDAEHVLRRMTEAIRHRGPDDEGQWVDAGVGIALGHRRLSILDLSPEGHQPMASASGRYVVVFNGEIYNFSELRADLEGTGVRWRGHSDTEVMLAAFERWGVRRSVERLVGMFAFGVWDRDERALHLVRDRLGEKPLYAGWMGNVFLFGSELKALRAHPAWRGEIDRGAVALLLRYSYIPQPWSIYHGIGKISPATILTLRDPRPGVMPVAEPYWSVRDAVGAGVRAADSLSDDEAEDAFDGLLRRSIASQMVADVPLGAFLSGGVDSSTIVALMQAQSARPVRTFTIGFHERAFNEAEHAKAVAAHLGTDHTELYVTPAEAQAVIPRLGTLYDEPFADPSQIPTFLVSALARRSVTVSLSGDGGDELLGGYDRYQITARVWSRMKWVPTPLRATVGATLASLAPERWDGLLRLAGPLAASGKVSGERIHKLAGLLSRDSPVSVYQGMLSHWSAPESVVLGAREPSTAQGDPTQWPPQEDFVQQMMDIDLVTYLPDDILVKVDRASMGVSLESRAPFLDHRVVEFALRLPLAQKIRAGRSKWLLRRVLERYVPPSLTERPKMGFGVPIDSWLRGPLRSWAEDLLSESRLKADGFLDPVSVRRTWNEHLSGRRNWQFRLWNVLMFQAWLTGAGARQLPDGPAARQA